jgi:hypothetical protein
MKVNCKKCGYTWLTKSRLAWLTCPNCRSAMQIRKVRWIGGQSNEPAAMPYEPNTWNKLNKLGRKSQNRFDKEIHRLSREPLFNNITKLNKKRRSSKPDVYDKISNFKL